MIANEMTQNNLIVAIKLKWDIPNASARIRKTIKDISIIRLLFNLSSVSGTNTKLFAIKPVANQGRRIPSISPVIPHPGPKRNSVMLGRMKYKILNTKHKIVDAYIKNW